MKYAWKPDIPDFRDHQYIASRRRRPTAVNLRRFCSKVEDQQSLGSCTGNALVGAMELLINKEKNNFIDLSRLFIYYLEREMIGTIHYDSGAYIRDGIKALAKTGVCSENLWPYNISKFRHKPAVRCYTDAEKRKIISYERLNTLDDMRDCLANGFPFVFGFSVYEGFESARVAKTGNASMPRRGEKFLGGHAVMAVGYNDRTRRLLVRNSWGSRWGKKGYFTLPYGYITTRNLSDDFWTIYK